MQDEHFNKMLRESLEDGISHEADCPQRDSSAPVDVTPCSCYEKWWYNKGRESTTC